MLIASTPTFWDVVWWMVIFAALALFIAVAIAMFIDNFRRKDHSGLAKAMWTVFIIFLPVIGVLAYIVARPKEPPL
jgi:hypothetical protein